MDSAIFDNMALGNGGGIYSDGTLTLIDSTVSSNTAAFANGGGGGGGIYSTGTLTLTESAVAGNSRGFCPPPAAAASTTTGDRRR